MLARTAQSLDRIVAIFLGGLLALMVLTVTWQVVTRGILQDPSSWTEEAARFLLVWIGLFGGAFAYHRRLHIGIDLLAERLHSHGARRHRWHKRLVHACILLFACVVLVGGGTSLVLLTRELEQYSPALGLPMAAVYSALPLSGLIMACFALAALSDHE